MSSKKPDPMKVVKKPNGELVIELEDKPKGKAKVGTKRAANGGEEPQPSSSKAPRMLSLEEKINQIEHAVVAAKSRMPEHENKEMLEEMDEDNNSYIKLGKLATAMITVTKRAAKLEGEKLERYQHMTKIVRLTVTDHPELRSAVEDFVNKCKAIDAIPFDDVLKIVKDMNEKRESAYGGKQKLRDLAAALCEEANAIISKRRKLETYGSHVDYAKLENASFEEDPSTTDEALKAKLEENKKQNVIDLDKIRARLLEDGGDSEQEDVDEEDYDESKDTEYEDVNEYDPDMLADSDLDDDDDPIRDEVEEEESVEDEDDGVLVHNGEEVDDDLEEQGDDASNPAAEADAEKADELIDEEDGDHNGALAGKPDVVEVDDSSSSSDSDCQIVSD